MKELFIREKDDRRLRLTVVITVLAAMLFLLVFTGCSPAKVDAVDQTKPLATVSFTVDQSSKYAPSFAVWIVDAQSGETATLYATKKAAENKWSGASERPGALPVWWPVRGQGATDVNTSATPGGKDVSLTLQIPDGFAGKQLKFFVEANVSYDYNDYYKGGLKSGDEGYNDVNGQPSVVWMAEADTSAAPSGTLAPAIIGHGDVLGANTDVEADMSHITTASSILTNLSIQYDFSGK